MLARLVVGVCLILAIWAGMWIRATAWRMTPTVRFGPDLNSAYHWGTRAREWGGVLRVYDEERARNPGQKLLDYPPLRLLIVTQWAERVRRTHPNFDVRGWSRNVVKPLLRVNLTAELATAVGIFLLVRTWLGRAPGFLREAPATSASSVGLRRASSSGLDRATEWAALAPPTSRALASALLFWFNPAVILVGHVFPQWDVWLLPAFVFGVLLATFGWWFWAGVLIAVGAMLKGQMLLVAPLFLLWPLFSRQWGAPLRWLAGFAGAGAAIAAPWLVGSPGGVLWVGALILGLGVARGWRARRSSGGAAVGALLLLLAVALGPWLLTPGRAGLSLGLLFAGALVVAAWLVPRGWTRYLAAYALAGALGISGVAFGGSFGWFHMGFRNQATRDYVFFSDVGNPGSILHHVFSWPADTPLLGPLLSGSGMGAPFGRPLTLGHLFVLAYVAGLVLCAWATSRHARGRDPRFLLAIAMPWVLLFALLPNIRTRYLVWGAGLTAVGPALGWGATLLHVVVTASASDNVLRTLLPRAVPPFAPGLRAALEAVHPHGGWVVLACSVALLWIVLRPAPRVAPGVGNSAGETARS
jgi:hypothetical protein